MYLYKRNPQGKYRMLFAFYPAMIDATYPGQLFWGYPWDIKDVVIARGSTLPKLSAAFDHTFLYDGNWTPPQRQTTVPFVMFRGITAQPNSKVQVPLRFRRQPVGAIELRARAKHRRKLG